MIGTTLGQYRIESEAGQGGMGVVYRATDTRLGRTVAIKVLRPDAVADPDRKSRFIQEAKSASALNHPGIVTIYQIGSEGATDFIAMEFVTGRSLDRVIGKRPLPMADAVRYAVQIAEALSAAHEAGIVHRDLKPANVMISDKGQLKVLDFGLAKLAEPSDVSPVDATVTSAHRTATHVILGTAAYMSPEQARGERVDRRSDVYSFGVVLHEMVTGSRPGPDLAAVLSTVPRDLQRIMRRCLQPNTADRFQSVDDLRMALQDADLIDRPAATTSPRWSRLAAVAAVALGAAAIGAGGAWWILRPRPAIGLTLRRLTLDSSLTTDQTISQDGRLVAYASDRGEGNLDIWVQQVGGGSPLRLTTDRADDAEPSFSPDGSEIAFRSDRDGGGVYVVSSIGGDARRIADAGRRPRWSPDGKLIAYWVGQDVGFLMSGSDAPRAYVVPPSGGAPKAIGPDLVTAWAPVWSADSAHLILLGSRDASVRPGWSIVSLDGQPSVRTEADAAMQRAGLAPSPDGFFVPAAWTGDDRVLFSARLGDSTNIWRLAGRPSGAIAAEPERVTAGSGFETTPAIDAAGRVVFTALTSNVDLWSLPVDTASGHATGPWSRLTDDSATDAYPWFTPDSSRLLFMSNRAGSYAVWIRNISTQRDAILAADASFPTMPVVAKDGSRAYFESARDSHRWLSLSLSGPSAVPVAADICPGCHGVWEFSTDGKWALDGKNGDTALVARNVSTGQTAELVQAAGGIVGRARISPDDRWVAFTHRTPGAVRAQLVPFRPGATIALADWIALTPTDAAATAPTWSLDGRLVYFFSDRDGHVCLWAQPIDRSTGRPSGEAIGVWHFHEARHSLGRIALPLRSMTIARDRIVLSLAESTGSVWLGSPATAR